MKKRTRNIKGRRGRRRSLVFKLFIGVGCCLPLLLCFVAAENSCYSSDSPITSKTEKNILLEDEFQFYQSWSYNALDRESDELKRDMLLPFKYYNCPALNEIRTLVEFVEMKMGNKPFHNFRHVSAVLHFAFALLTLGDGQAVFGESFRKYIYSILLSILLHDLEHPGNNNDYEVKIKSEIATKYNNESVLENHSSRVGIDKIIELNLLPKLGLAPDEVTYVQNEIHNTILYTDPSKHGKLSTRLQELSSRWARIKLHDEELTDYDFQTLIYAFVHASDLNNLVQKYKEVTFEWYRRIVAEFQSQSRLEKAKRLQVTPFMSTLDSESARIKMQIDFTSHNSLYFKDLAKIIPNIEHFNDIIEENYIWWKDRLKSTAG
mmetsp:Transcript_2596/g.3625  ORF Transcript_2596/g.3625 Transcript_2596/m.3625 type:complete len:377 (-) Transcript_2596:270-1400(-)